MLFYNLLTLIHFYSYDLCQILWKSNVVIIIKAKHKNSWLLFFWTHYIKCMFTWSVMYESDMIDPFSVIYKLKISD